MIMSSSPVTSGNENDSQLAPERVLVVTRWLGAHHGPLDRIVLPREPATEQERSWVETELLTRLVPGGEIEVADENHSQTELHHVTFDAIEDTLVFTCLGDDSAKCHNYPGCECESWSDDHEHPAVLHDRCWMQDWFDSLAVSYDGEDTNIDGFGPYEISGSGAVKTEFEEDFILWSWVNYPATS